jgi:hypothetical protein
LAVLGETIRRAGSRLATAAKPEKVMRSTAALSEYYSTTPMKMSPEREAAIADALREVDAKTQASTR